MGLRRNPNAVSCTGRLELMGGQRQACVLSRGEMILTETPTGRSRVNSAFLVLLVKITDWEHLQRVETI